MKRQKVLVTLVLVGWILIGPPTRLRSPAEKGITFDQHAPISQWEHISAHDTAASCEDARAALPPREEDKRGLSSEAIVSFLAYKIVTRCVPAEHLYPPRAPMPRTKNPREKENRD